MCHLATPASAKRLENRSDTGAGYRSAFRGATTAVVPIAWSASYRSAAAPAQYDLDAIVHRIRRSRTLSQLAAENGEPRSGFVCTIAKAHRDQFQGSGQGPPSYSIIAGPSAPAAWRSGCFFLPAHEDRCIAHVRRGHSRSREPWSGTVAAAASSLVQPCVTPLTTPLSLRIRAGSASSDRGVA